ncbi:MAG: hypothetical protein EOO59_06655 [Hymenobacter sp.]|nr:MAG: hypothetical protein EOO59_06655 [Hymenobacter sp.]
MARWEHPRAGRPAQTRAKTGASGKTGNTANASAKVPVPIPAPPGRAAPARAPAAWRPAPRPAAASPKRLRIPTETGRWAAGAVVVGSWMIFLIYNRASC